MRPEYHREITADALASLFSPRAFRVILRANLGQDALQYQVGYDHFHFDNNQLESSYAYLEEQRALVKTCLERGETESAWHALGRLTHTAQDFYAHSNYIPLWLDHFNGGPRPAPGEVDPVSAEILNSSALHTGMIYYPLEVFAFFKPLRKYVLPHLPADSHAHMNHDGPDISPHFDYVLAASVKRTRVEFDQTAALLSADQLARFVDR